MEGKNKLISVNNLKKTYYTGKVEVPVLKGISLRMKKGEFIAIMGPSGSGKSTLMNILGCLDKPSEGTYSLDDFNVGTLNEDKLAEVRNRKIGFVFQTFNLLGRHSAVENVELPLLYSGLDKTREKAMSALDEVGLSDRADHRPNELSGGENQRVAIARAIVVKPAIILADEPTGNLDSRTSNEIMQIFKQLNKKGATIIIVTHEPEIAGTCKRIIYIRDGMIQKDTAIKHSIN